MKHKWTLAETEIDQALALYAAVFGEELLRAEFKERSGKFDVKCLALKDENNSEAGFALLRCEKTSAELWFCGIVPARRRCGAGSALIEQVENLMASLGYTRLTAALYNHWNIMLGMLVTRGYRILDVQQNPRREDLQITVYRELRQRRELRYAITSACNFKCVFCHNEGLGTQTRPSADESLTADVLIEAVRMGFTDITITGGEPTLKKHALLKLINRLSSCNPLPDLTIITNGSKLDRDCIDAIAAYGGAKKIHLSLHSSNADSFAQVTGVTDRGMFDTVVSNIRACTAAGLTVKMNHVVLRERNHRDILNAIELARSMGVSAIKLIELLVLPEHPLDYSYFVNVDSLHPQLRTVAEGPLAAGLRKNIFRHRQDSSFTIETQRCTCQLGCAHCRETRDRTLANDLCYQPCFVLSSQSIPVKAPEGLAEAMRKGDRIIDGFAHKYGDESPTLIKKERYVDAKVEMFFCVDNAVSFREHMSLNGFRHVQSIGFREECYRPKLFGSEWREYKRNLRLGFDHDKPGHAQLLYTDHEYRTRPDVGMEVRTRFLHSGGPMDFASRDDAEHFLDRLDFERFAIFDWQLEVWSKGSRHVTLSLDSNRPTVKMSGECDDVVLYNDIFGTYQTGVRPLLVPLIAHMLASNE